MATIIAHGPETLAEENGGYLLTAATTNRLVEVLAEVGIVVDEIHADDSDRDDLVVYCFCGHEESSHDGGTCSGCADDLDHDVDPSHAFQAAT